LIKWEDRILVPDLQVAHYNYYNNTRHFNLIVEPIIHHILEDLAVEALGYNGNTPGPLIIVREGEWINLTVENRLDEPTAVHVHGLAKPNSQDGAPDIEPATPLIDPGEKYTYRFQARESGSFFYHSLQDFQTNRGLLGPLIVLPKSLIQVPDQDVPLCFRNGKYHN